MTHLYQHELGELSKIPLCPKCSDTKYVIESPCIKMIPNYVTFECTKCNLSWDACITKIEWDISDRIKQ